MMNSLLHPSSRAAAQASSHHAAKRTRKRTRLGLVASVLTLALTLAIGCIAAAAHAQVRYGLGLGRLLTTESERSRIDDNRFNVKAVALIEAKIKTAVEVEVPSVLRIEGLSHRPDRPAGQRISVWINGKPFAEASLPYGLSLVRNNKGEIIGMNSVVAKGKTEFAKIGDSLTRPQTLEEAKAERAAGQAAAATLATPSAAPEGAASSATTAATTTSKAKP
ncbi:MAG: hypothetical protein QM533_10810 [Cytophagales bacterium]|nr:hypothetical protein [Cytophagales bacterium]